MLAHFNTLEFVLKLFTLLHDRGIVEVDVFRTWKEDDDDQTEGKIKALFKVNQWLQEIIANADAEDDDEEGGEGD